jgi:hypothetical protein
VAIETWSHAVKDGKRASTLPYFHWVFPYVKLRQSGDRVIENGLLANTFEGYGLGNLLFGDGLDDRWEFPTAAGRPYSYARTNWAPTGRNGFYTWHGELSASVSNKLREDGVVTLTTAQAHNYVEGETVTITGGTKTVTVTAISTTSGTATYTAGNTGTNALIVGETIVVTGCTPAGYNGTFVITARTDTNFAAVNATAGPGTVFGTGTVNTLNDLT